MQNLNFKGILLISIFVLLSGPVSAIKNDDGVVVVVDDTTGGTTCPDCVSDPVTHTDSGNNSDSGDSGNTGNSDDNGIFNIKCKLNECITDEQITGIAETRAEERRIVDGMQYEFQITGYAGEQWLVYVDVIDGVAYSDVNGPVEGG